MEIKKFMIAGASAAILGLVAVAASTGSASAYVACNRDGDCWHTDNRVHAPGAAFDYHPDDWYFHQHWDATHHWRDYHEGRGYWRSGVWVTL